MGAFLPISEFSVGSGMASGMQVRDSCEPCRALVQAKLRMYFCEEAMQIKEGERDILFVLFLPFWT